jgi:hypothetical protein
MIHLVLRRGQPGVIAAAVLVTSIPHSGEFWFTQMGWWVVLLDKLRESRIALNLLWDEDPKGGNMDCTMAAAAPVLPSEQVSLSSQLNCGHQRTISDALRRLRSPTIWLSERILRGR